MRGEFVALGVLALFSIAAGIASFLLPIETMVRVEGEG